MRTDFLFPVAAHLGTCLQKKGPLEMPQWGTEDSAFTILANYGLSTLQ
jgi:hypothetical protein